MNRILIILPLFVFCSCSANTGELPAPAPEAVVAADEQDNGGLLGNWRASRGKNALGQEEFIDLRLEDGGKGYFGAGLNEKDGEKYLPFLSFTISNWSMHGDTLFIEGKVDETQATGGKEIQMELAGIAMVKAFVVKNLKDGKFTGMQVEPDASVLRMMADTDGPKELTFEKRP